MRRQIHYRDITEIMTLKGAYKKKGRRPVEADLGLVRNASLIVDGKTILWVGPSSRCPEKYKSIPQKSLKGAYVYPGFVDCHTHLVFAGDRKSEFELRNQGVSYQEIARQGGGIQSTVAATRKAKLSELVSTGQERVENFVSQGVTSLEIKSGYGLNEKTELKILEAIKALKRPRIISTFLGAHGIPKEYKSEGEYLLELVSQLDRIKKKRLSRRVDIFVEKNYFSIEGARKYLKVAQDMGFDLTIHADQLSRTQATRLAVELKALSADHVICAKKKDIALLAASETTAVFLPAADFYLHCDYPPAREFIDQGAKFALATDFNPGSSPTQNIGLVGLLARLQMKMTLPEVFVAFTLGGASALGGHSQFGALVPGQSADFFSCTRDWRVFFYDGQNPAVQGVWCEGRKIF